MSGKIRCMSKWKKITVIDNDKKITAEYELNELGQHKTKIKTQNRRKLHERGRTMKIKDLSKASIPKEGDESKEEIRTFDVDVSIDQDNSMFGNFQNFQDFEEISMNNRESNFEFNVEETVSLNENDNFLDFNDFAYFEFNVEETVSLNENDNFLDFNDFAYFEFNVEETVSLNENDNFLDFNDFANFEFEF